MIRMGATSMRSHAGNTSVIALYGLFGLSALLLGACGELSLGKGLESDPNKPNAVVGFDPDNVGRPVNDDGGTGPGTDSGGPGPGDDGGSLPGADSGPGPQPDSSSADGGPGDDGGGTGDDGGTWPGADAPVSGPDGGTEPDAGGGPDAGPGPDSGPSCSPPVTGVGDGHHNPGKNCMSCHNSLAASLKWTVAGTLYDAVSGGSAVAGATVTVTDANGKKVTMISQTNGNFYTTEHVVFPLNAGASSCPDSVRMNGTVTGGGSCNRTGCHASGFRLHLP
jgi:hypothetical protein